MKYPRYYGNTATACHDFLKPPSLWDGLISEFPWYIVQQNLKINMQMRLPNGGLSLEGAHNSKVILRSGSIEYKMSHWELTIVVLLLKAVSILELYLGEV